MSARWLIAVCIALCSILGSGCGDGPVVLVDIQGPLEQIVRVRASATVRYEDPTKPPAELRDRSVPSAVGRIRVRLPEDATGLLTLSLDGLTAEGCVALRGTASKAVDAALSEGMILVLEPYARGCELALSVRGGGSIRVGGIDQPCHRECTFPIAKREPIELVPEPDPDSYFLGWDGACTGNAECRLTVPDTGGRVIARFAPLRLCGPEGLCWERPLPSGAEFFGLWTSPAGTLWAVGEGGTILRNDSGYWYSEPAPGLGTRIRAIWGRSDEDVWVVGDCGVVRHFNGREWTRKSPYMSEDCSVFPSLSFVFGVGERERWIGGEKGALWRFDGQAWIDQNPLLGLARSFDLVAGHGTAPDDLWISNLIEAYHYDGKKLTTFPFPAMSNPLQTLRQFASKEAYISARNGRMFRIKGTNMEDLGRVSTDASLLSLWEDPDGGLWAVGRQGVVVHKASGSEQWSILPTTTLRTLNAVSGRSANDVWVVGEGGLIFHWDGGNWASDNVSYDRTGLLVGGLDADNVWFSASPSSVIGYLGGSTFIELRGPQFPVGIAVTAPDRIWVLTNRSIERVTDDDSSAEQCIGLGPWNDFSGSGASGKEQLFAVGYDAALLRYDAASKGCVLEILLALGMPLPTLLSVWPSGSNELWLGGERTLGLYDLKSRVFTPRATLAADDAAFSITGTDPDNVWALTASGSILHFYKGQPRSVPFKVVGRSGPFLVTAVRAVSETETWIIGREGLVARLTWSRGADGEPQYAPTWSLLTTGAPVSFTSIWSSSANDVWLTGSAGEILHYRR